MSARDYIIPDWITKTDPSGQLRGSTGDAWQRNSKPVVLQAPGLAEDAIIPIIYGGPERIAGMQYTVCLAANGTDLLVSYILCEGEIESVSNVEVNNAAPAAGVAYRVYLGTAGQGIDPDLAAAIPGFDEAMAGTAYIVARFAPGSVNGMPNITAEVMGLRIPDPRAGGALGPWDNPALIVDHLEAVYGRRTVNEAATIAAADFADELIEGERRSRLTITLKESRPVEDWAEVIRGYVPAWLVENQATGWHTIPDTATAPVLDYDADSDDRTDGAAPMALFKRGARDVPNVVEVSYTDTAVKPWTTKKAVASLSGIGAGERRKSTLSFPGIRSYAQAYRFAVERLNHYTLESIEGEIAVMDDGIRILPGDIITITDAAHGWDAKEVRVLRADESDNGRWKLRFREFNAGAYSIDAPAAPLPPSSGTLPNPTTIAAVTGLSAAEALRFEKDSVSGTFGTGLIWQSRITATWDASADPFFDFYEVAIQAAVDAQPAVSTSKLAQFNSAPLIQNQSYAVRVRALNSLGFASAWTETTVQVQGKTAPPSNVSAFDFAAEIGGEVILRWVSVPDVDVIRYEVRGLATAATSAPWESMSVIQRVDDNYTRIRGLAPGTTLFAVKAVDAVGRLSVDALYVSVLITSDASNFLQTFAFVFPMPGNTHLVEYSTPLVESGARPLPRWITKATQTWNASMPNPVGSVNAPVVAGFGRNSAWNAFSDTWDFGLALEASVSLNLQWVTALSGSPRVYLAQSLDGATWDYTLFWSPVAGGASLGTVTAKVAARYLRIEIYNQSALTDSVMIEGPINVQVSATTRSEVGSATSSASVAKRCNLAQKYTKAVAITVTPRGTTFATASYDNVQVGLAVTPNYFDVWLFNSAGQPIAQAFSWQFEGV